MQKLLHRLGLMLCFVSAVSYAQPQIFDYKLANGLQLLVKPDHRSPVVFSSIWYKVGGSYEHNGITGVSHVLEHMMFRGTERFGPGVLDKMISAVGGQQNAMTSNDFTMYYQKLPADQLDLSFKLESDRMKNLLLRDQDFTKEIQVVMEERRMRYDDDPQSLTQERFLAAAFINNPYHHQVIGWMTDLKNMTIQNVRQWYQTWYQPNNAIIVVVGDVEPKRVLQLAQNYFGSIKEKAVPMLKPRTEVESLGRVSIEVNLPAKLPLLIMGYQTPTLTNNKEVKQAYALDVLSNVLAGSSSSRLINRLVRGKQLATSLDTSYNPFNLHSNVFQLFAVPRQGVSLPHVEQAILDQVKLLQTQLVNVDELERIKAQMIASKVYSRDSLQSQGMILGIPSVVGLSWKIGENYVDQLSKVTPQEVQAVAKRFLINHALTVAYLHPQQANTQQMKNHGEVKSNAKVH